MTREWRNGSNHYKVTACAALLVILFAWGHVARLAAGQEAASQTRLPASPSKFHGKTTRAYNHRLEQLLDRSSDERNFLSNDYRIGPEDLLKISVYAAPDLGGTFRVSAAGDISLPLLGRVRAARLTEQQLGNELEKLLRHSYMKHPHVTVLIQQMESHSVSVFGAVEKPGVYQIRGPETLIEVLSRARGLAPDAGDTVIVMRQGSSTAGHTHRSPTNSPGETEAGAIRIHLRDLLDSTSSRFNVQVDPGDVVKVTRAGIVYVVGEVKKPGGFLLKTNENISVLQAIALAEGLSRTAAARHARIIRTDKDSGKRVEIPINLKKILAGKTLDPVLHNKDIVFIPNSTGKAAFFRGAEAALSIAGGVIVYRR